MIVVSLSRPQRDPQVGVGAQVVLDHAGRALGGQDQVQAERAAALGDIDDAVDEFGDSVASAANSSTTMTRLGGRLRVAGLLESTSDPWRA